MLRYLGVRCMSCICIPTISLANSKDRFAQSMFFLFLGCRNCDITTCVYANMLQVQKEKAVRSKDDLCFLLRKNLAERFLSKEA